ncbi:cell division protein FtsN [Azospirillum lipoferum]|uniref:SPOR domain-containing protein n=1 Tax=Azospirillum TaxID=191 RepID=UPI001FEBE266|nr:MULTISPECIES: SPOR domain-containing protein [Azospirillum]MCP1609828.1 cell division protein FtsN [Azospirillum lipoferum]MDW5534868.1 SPOR domain-containing protein [Azospirillum sp. NL1]
MTLKPPYRQAPTLTTPTFKDEMKANGKPSETPPPENEDIAKLLRALNEDLRADPQDDDLEYEEEEPAGRSRLPLGKIALALVAAGGIAVGVVYLGSGDPAPVTTAANNSAPMVPAPAITRAPSNQTSANPAPATPTPTTGSLPTPATTTQATATQTPAAQTPPVQTAPVQTAPSAAPPPPVAALPASPPPVLKVPEPPAVPATATAATPKPRATAESPPSAPAVQKPEAPKPEAAKPETPAETGSLQAMLAPPKETAKRPAAPTPAAPSAAPPSASSNGEAKPTAKVATPSAPPPAGRYTVQVGSFSVTANADSLVQRLQGNGFQAYTVDWTDSSNRSWRAVRVGGYPDPAAAKREAEQLKSKMGLNPVVVTTR